MAQLKEDLRGRTVLYTDVLEVDDSNIGDVLSAAIEDHDQNSTAIDYLYEYYKGDQPINTRQKTYNTDINNVNIVVVLIAHRSCREVRATKRRIDRHELSGRFSFRQNTVVETHVTGSKQ